MFITMLVLAVGMSYVSVVDVIVAIVVFIVVSGAISGIGSLLLFLSFLFPFSNFWKLTDWSGAGLVSAYDL